jgi:hypothetical protein
LREEWSDASFVFSNCTTFENNILEDIFKKVQKLKRGSFFVHTSNNFPDINSRKFESIKPIDRLMSWGIGTLFIHRRK